MSIDIKPGYNEDLIKLLYDDVQELKKAKTINGTPNTGPENRPVSGSKIAFIYAED